MGRVGVLNDETPGICTLHWSVYYNISNLDRSLSFRSGETIKS